MWRQRGLVDKARGWNLWERRGRRAKRPRITRTLPHMEPLEARLLLSTTPLITEFMASNGSTLADGDGNFSDWIEVQNRSDQAIDLGGWHLTDDASRLDTWAFPELPQSLLDPGEYLVVFASDQSTPDYVDAGGFLHTTFALSADGEYLALVQPDGTTIGHEYAPQFPSQERDISYGIGVTQQDVLVDIGDAAEILVPTTADDLDPNWATEDFVPEDGWFSGTTGIGFDADSTGSVVVSYDASLGGVGVAPDPTSQGWHADHTGGPPGQQVLDVSPDLGLDAWGVIDQGGGGRLEYEFNLSGEQIADGNANGWTLATTSRTLAGAYDVLVYRDGARQYLVWKEIDAGGDLVVDLVGDTRYTLTSGGTGADAYFDHDLTYDPATGLATYWFDGTAIATWNGSAHSGTQVIWGSGSTSGQGEAHYHQVTLTTGNAGAFTPYIETDVETPMAGVNASAFVRLPFTIVDPTDYDTLTLDVQYDDGFIAYLNGMQVVSSNAPGTPAYNSAATAAHDDVDAVQFESFDLSEHVDLLQAGDHVLAIHVLNESASDDDLLLTPRLTASDSAEENLLYFTTPTPGGANSSGFLGFAGETIFSVDRGFFDSAFDVEITSPTVGAAIYYTTDGSTPSASHGALYIGPINISTTTVLRATATVPRYLPADVDTHSYFFLNDVLLQDGTGLPLPPFPATSTWDYAMDPNIVNDPRFSTLVDDLQTLPTLSLVMDEEDAWGANGFYATLQEGQAGERPVSVELIGTDGVGQFQEDAGIRVMGSGNLRRAVGKKSMRLVFRSEFGPTKLNYPFFGSDYADEIDTIALRGNYFDTWTFQSDDGGLGGPCCGRSRSLFLRDQFAHETHQAMGAHAIAGNFVHLYINGQYWGLYNPTERPDEEFLQSYFGGSEADYDVIKTGVDIVAGDLAGWNEMMTIVRGNGPHGSLANDAAYHDLQPYLDIGAFADYLLLNFYGGNHDWPHNNWYAVRNRTESGPFVFYEWDAENFLFSVDSDRTGISNANTAGEIYSNLRQNDQFNLLFADRAQRHMFNDGVLTPAAAAARFQAIVDTIRPALNPESARWGDELQEPPHNTFDDFDAAVAEKLDNYFPVRTDMVLGQLRSAGLYPATAAPTLSQHGGHVESGFPVTMTAPAGTIYYTLDGSDPRLADGSVNPDAVVFDYGSATSTTLITEGDTWRYLDDGSDQGTAWKESSFVDTAWPVGDAELGYGNGDEVTVVDFIDADPTTPGIQKNATTFFRKTFSVAHADQVTQLTMHIKVDDGAVVYLNGNEVERINIPGVPGDPVAHTTTAVGSANSDGNPPIAFSLDPADLVEGPNVIAVEVHQVSATSDDISFDLELIAHAASGGAGPPILISAETTIQARVRDGIAWSALTAARFTIDPPGDASNLKITEMNYNPHNALTQFGDAPVDHDEFEFLELTNVGAETIDLTGVQLVNRLVAGSLEGVEFTFPAVALASGASVLVVENLSAFESRYGTGLNVAGEWTGSLSNAGERITLLAADEEVIQQFDYNDRWEDRTDGRGSSLVVIDTSGDYGTSDNWRASTAFGGTPARRRRDGRRHRQ